MSQHSSSGCSSITGCIVVARPTAGPVGRGRRSPLVAFDCSPVQQEKGYSSLQDEAVKIFNSLQEIETVSDPIPIIQGILQTCHDLKPLRDEVYCQLIKQTNHMPHPNSTGNLHHWQLMACMSCTFLPSRGILRYLKFHLRR